MLKNRENKYSVHGECPKCSAPTVENYRYPGKIFYTCECFPHEDRVPLSVIFDDAASVKPPAGTRPILG